MAAKNRPQHDRLSHDDWNRRIVVVPGQLQKTIVHLNAVNSGNRHLGKGNAPQMVSFNARIADGQRSRTRYR